MRLKLWNRISWLSISDPAFVCGGTVECITLESIKDFCIRRYEAVEWRVVKLERFNSIFSDWLKIIFVPLLVLFFLYYFPMASLIWTYAAQEAFCFQGFSLILHRPFADSKRLSDFSKCNLVVRANQPKDFQ